MFLIAFNLAYALGTSASVIFSVSVGENGQLQYVPNEVFANKGDSIIFEFMDGNHTLTQSTFDDPCTPMEGGIDTGIQHAPEHANSTQLGIFYTLHIYDTSSPLWFFCAQTVPASHCQAGMVFAVNPTPNQTFIDFQLRANASGSSPTIPLSSASVASGPATTSSRSSSLTGSSTTSPDPSSRSGSSARVVIPVGICIGLTVILAAATLLWCRCVRRRHQPAQSTGRTVKTVLHPFFVTPGTGTTNRLAEDVPRLTASKRLTELAASVPGHPGQSTPQQPRSVPPRLYGKFNRRLIPIEHQDNSNRLGQGTATVLTAPEPPSERGMLITMIRRLEAVEATIAHIPQPDPVQALDSNRLRSSLPNTTTSTNDWPPDYVSQPEFETRRTGGMGQGVTNPRATT